MKKCFAILALAVGCVGLLAQEKGLGSPKNTGILADLFNNRAATTTGSLLGAPTYDRIFTSSVDPNCMAPSSFSGSGVGVPYALIEVHTANPAGENLIAAVNPAGTDVDDTTMSFYCDPFNPADASLNLVAYNDDVSFPTNLLSAFDGTEGAFMQPGVSYFLVVSLFSPADIGGGTFQLDVGGDIQFGPPCQITGMTYNASPSSVTIDGACLSGVDIYVERLNGSTQLLAGGVAVDGPTDVPVSFFPDSIYFATPAGDASTILASTVRTVPTLSQWGLIAFLTLLAGAGLYFMRKRRMATS